MKVFTDNIVVSYKAQHLEIERGERELVLSQPRNSSWRNGTLDTGKLMMGKRQFKVPSISGMTEY